MRVWMLRGALGVVAAAVVGCGADEERSSPNDGLDGSATDPEVRVADVLGPEIPPEERTRVMVLASHHLAELGDEFRPELLDGVVEALEGFGPELVAVEALAPGDIAAMRALGGYDGILDGFAARPIRLAERARDHLGLADATPFEAESLQLELLKRLASGEGAQEEIRLDLVLHSLAAYDYHTALLQWSHLDAESRRDTGAIPREVREELQEQLDSPNERVSIGLRLARDLGHDRLHAVDDQMTMALQSRDEVEGLMAAMEEESILEEVTATYERIGEVPLAEALEEGDLLPYYLRLNSAEHAEEDVGTQWAAFLDERIETVPGRARVARREARDLRITTHIRRVTARHPGSDVLVVYGASHKPFLESYLASMSDIDLVQFAEFVDEAE